MGRSRHVKVLAAESGPKEGRLQVAIEWVMPDGSVVIDEDTTFVFRGGVGQRIVDRTTRLTARASPVRFADNKEGFLGLRVARSLEHPSTEPATFTDAAGRATAVAVLDNTGVTGRYRSSEGQEGDDVWGDPEVNAGGGAWYPPAIDTEAGVVYWGIANPAPFPGTEGFPNGTSRPGPNLYTNSVVALDVHTGELQWYHQAIEHDLFDRDLD